MQMWLQYQSRRMSLMLMLGVFTLDDPGRWIDPGEINTATLQSYLSGAGQTQDQLSGIDRLPSFERLSGGRSIETVRQMGSNDVAPAEVPATAQQGIPSTYTFTVPRESALAAQTAPAYANGPETAAVDLPLGPAASDYQRAAVNEPYAELTLPVAAGETAIRR